MPENGQKKSAKRALRHQEDRNGNQSNAPQKDNTAAMKMIQKIKAVIIPAQALFRF